MVQWLRLPASIAGGTSSIPKRIELRTCCRISKTKQNKKNAWKECGLGSCLNDALEETIIQKQGWWWFYKTLVSTLCVLGCDKLFFLLRVTVKRLWQPLPSRVCGSTGTRLAGATSDQIRICSLTDAQLPNSSSILPSHISRGRVHHWPTCLGSIQGVGTWIRSQGALIRGRVLRSIVKCRKDQIDN